MISEASKETGQAVQTDAPETDYLATGIDLAVGGVSKNHYHKVNRHHHIYTVAGHSHSVAVPDHTHSVSVPAHAHSVSIPGHTHNLSLSSHTHSVSIPEHSHGVSIPAHAHDIEQGIFTFGGASAANLYVNSVFISEVRSDMEADITAALVDADSGKITRGKWHSIEVRPVDLVYVSIDMFVQGFVQSKGGANY
jgi:hypothetical protein